MQKCTVTFEMVEKLSIEVVATSLLLTSKNNDLLRCKDVWIRDTRVTQHSTFSLRGGRNQCTCDVLMKGTIGKETTNVTLTDFLV